MIEAGFDAKTGAGAASALLARDGLPTAVVCANDEVAHALVAVAAGRGLRVPHDLSIVGFDDSMFAQLAHPGLTTVAQPTGRIARAATESLVRLVGARPRRPPPSSLPNSSPATRPLAQRRPRTPHEF